MTVRIARLADHADVLETLVAAFEQDWQEWYGPGGQGDARNDLSERMNRGVLPLALVALDGGQPVGSLTLSANSIHEHPELTPALIGFWVREDFRNRGIGARLLRASYEEARKMNLRTLHAATSRAASLFRREGWQERDRFLWNGEMLTVFSRGV
jgi:predicted N-acetyltransferase YhbS